MFVTAIFDKTNKCELLSQVDKKLSELGKNLYQKYAFGVKSCDMSQTKNITRLSDFRKILVDKINGHDCYRDISQKDIENIIKRYLY